MNKVFGLVAILLLGGCLSREEKADLVQNYVDNGEYVQDGRTKLCYLYTTTSSVTYVPCTEEVLRELNR